MDPQNTTPAGDQHHDNTSRITKIGRSIKDSMADFFGLGDDASRHLPKWQNRRVRYLRWKLKDASGTDTAELDELDGHVDNSHESLYYPCGPTRKISVLEMTIKAVQTLMDSRKRRLADTNRRNERAAVDDIGDVTNDTRVCLTDDVPSTDVADTPVDMLAEGTGAGSGDIADSASVPSAETRKDVEASPTRERDDAGVDMPDDDAGVDMPDDDAGVDMPDDDAGVDMPDIGVRELLETTTKFITEKDDRDTGFVACLIQRMYRWDRVRESTDKTQRDEFDDHRPFFTYWVTFCQVVVFIVAVAVYGIAPIGSSQTVTSEAILKPNLAYELTRHVEIDNIWIGPRQADLIHLGAKYSPCMRRDKGIHRGLDKDLYAERESACCVRDDGSGCAQMTETRCAKSLNTWYKWEKERNKEDSRSSGSVCGQDPRYCKTPASVAPFVWPDDITKWEICTETSTPNATDRQDRHMSCKVTGRPCCHGIQGECLITTREHCDFIRGYFHEDAFLCSQVPCMKQICGMIPFTQDQYPDQFYRLWTSLFLHGGLFHLLITLVFQMVIMRDMEKLTGAIRMTIIYVGSGIAGNLASCIFVPYQVEMGPAGSQFGVMACLLVEVLQSWNMLEKPANALRNLLVPIAFLFILGFLPWIDNWAHVSGFIFGFLIAFPMLPYVSLGVFDRRSKLITLVISLGGAALLFVLLVIMFYVLPLYNCPGCQYFNCIPYKANFCKNMEINIERNTTYNDV